MHILLIHQAFASIDEPGGTRHHELARYLMSKGHSITVITSPISYLTGVEVEGRKNRGVDSFQSQGTKTIEGGNIQILRTYVYPALHRSFIHRILNFISFMISSFIGGLSVRQVDLVWGTTPPIFQGVTAWLLARIKRVPFLLEVRDLWPAFAVQVGVLRTPWIIWASEWLERFLYDRADRIMVNSPGFLPHITQRSSKPIELIPNGSDTSMFNPKVDGNPFRTQNSLEGKYIVLYAGAHGLSNDLGVVLDAASLLTDLPNLSIVLIGAGKEKPSLETLATDLKLKNVRFLNPVAKNRMPEVLAAADVCLAILKPVPLYATVYPNKVFDYLAAGKPVILAIDGVIREVVEDAQAGIYTQPGNSQALADTIRWMVNNQEQAREMGKNGFCLVQSKFDRLLLAEKFRKLVEKMVVTE